MYWGDAGLNKIEMANLDGSGRQLLWASNSSVTLLRHGVRLDLLVLYRLDYKVENHLNFLSILLELLTASNKLISS
jgi:hypothetical protein